MDKELSPALLAQFEKDFSHSRANRLAMGAVTRNGIVGCAVDFSAPARYPHQFSVSVDSGEATSQKQSGRCWMFAALNVMRLEVMEKLNLASMELSQSYPLFFDKLEKSNYFLENILETLEEPTDGRLLCWLLSAPLGDGGQWDMFANLVRKYGVVPKDVMPESKASSATKELNHYLTAKLREFACLLRTGYAEGKPLPALRAQKQEMMATVYRMLCISLGQPPRRFTWQTRDKKGNFVRLEDITPQQFFGQYVGMELERYVSLINAPTADKPFERTYTVRFLGNVAEGNRVKYLNLTADCLKQAAIAQLKDGKAVWFGSDVGQFLLREEGLMTLDTVRLEELFDTSFGMTKAQRLEYGESLMTHAMVLTGVDLDAEGRPLRWRVENSWGKDVGKEGYFVMSDDWFTQYTYQVVVDQRYLAPAQRGLLAQPPIVLHPWDPMGSLATVW